MQRLILVAAVGLVSQFVDGALGMGYGTMAASALIVVGLVPALVSASVHTAEVLTTLVSGVSHVRLGNVDKSITLPLAISGIVGGVLGAYALASFVSGAEMKPFAGAILLLLGIVILLRSLKIKLARPESGKYSKKWLLPLGFVAGAVDAISGGGWGPIATSTLVIRNQTTPRYVIGSVNLAEFFVTVSISLTFGLTLGFQNFLWHITLPLIIGGVLIAPVAAYAARWVSPAFLSVMVGLLLISLNAKTVSQPLFSALGIAFPRYFDILFLTFVGLIVLLLVIGLLSRSKRVVPEGS
jgi:uncharacterized membrane protein YfcA